ncbi:armadillo repeat-containing protein 4 [Thalassophryne amazonica]|uniref:armadillo repeat-containing protein 4 n=1 Tax=Thalassophryne amazonica TaxID=390379 RepID=UPI001471AC7C|nr:armadillo repeat-containing protein 4 [Thalassophryne amazonica]
MGLALTKAAQWTTASSGAAHLESTPMNESLLNEILHFVQDFNFQHPEEANHIFNQPLQWRTTLVASDFTADYDISDSTVQSLEQNSEGHPLLELSPPTITVHNFSQLSKLIHLTNHKKKEVQACIEENRDPVVKILGSWFATLLEGGDHSLHLMEAIKQEDDSTKSEVKASLFRLLQNIDNQLLNNCVQEISQQVRLNPTAVNNEVESLKQLCSEGERWLNSVCYTSDFEFSNGCRAPPWRQLHGEMCYLVIDPCDTETLYITCSNAGVFLNEGIKQVGEENAFQRTSDIYDDLVTLLKSRSAHFAGNLNKEDCAVEEQGQPKTSHEEHDKNVYEELRQHELLKKQGSKKRFEPCPRWNNFGFICPSSEAEEKKSKGSSGKEMSGKMLRKPLRPKSTIKSDFSVPALPKSTSCTKNKTSSRAMPLDGFSESSSESEEDEDKVDSRPTRTTDRPSEYWQIQKIIKGLKGGNQTATVLALCAIMDFNLAQETSQLAIRDVGGLEVLINLLETEDSKCKIGSLKILRTICLNLQIRRAVVDMGGLQTIVKILDLPVKELKALAAETIANIAKFHRARTIVRLYGGIKRLVQLLECVPDSATLSAEQVKDIDVACCGALALWSCSKSSRNKEAIRKAGGIPLLGRLLKSTHESMLIPVVGTLQECASEECYRIAIQAEGMVKGLVKNLSWNNDELQMYCASAIFKCAEEKQTRDLVRQYQGLQPLVSLLSKTDNKQLLAATTGAIWKCSISVENVAKFQEYNVLEILVGLLTEQPEEVLINVVGALGRCAHIPANKVIIRKCGGIEPLVQLLTRTNKVLLVNVTMAVGACATDMENMVIIESLDGVCKLWSLLNNPNVDVQASAAWAICPCVENAKDAGEMVRSFGGGLELIVNLLKSTNNEVLASVCAAITKIATDKTNLAIITDHGVVPLLAELTNTRNDRLRYHLADVIGHCCILGCNRISFGEAGVVAPLVHYLKSSNSAVHQTTAHALFQLSKEPNNCITMHKNGVVRPLIAMMGSDDEALQESAAGCVANIRRLALTIDKCKYGLK